MTQVNLSKTYLDFDSIDAMVEYTVECIPEYEDIEDCFDESLTGYDETETIASIWYQLDCGNQWAWCCVKVTARFGTQFAAEAYLGACSYADEQDFTHSDSDYYEDLKHEALLDLHAQIIKSVQELGLL